MNQRHQTLLGYDEILRMLSDCAVSESGKRAAVSLNASFDPEEVARMLAETKEAETIAKSKASDPVLPFPDVTAQARRLGSYADLNCLDLLNVMRFFKAVKNSCSVITRDDERNIQLLPSMTEGLVYDDRVIQEIEMSILSEDEVADAASSELRSIRRKIRSENDSIREKLNSIIRGRETGKYLQEAIITQRNGRYVVPVKQEYRAQVKGLVHGESASGATVFIEPMGVVESNNRLRSLEEEENREIMRILSMLSEMIRPYAQAISSDMEIMTALDLIFAKNRLAGRMDASPCEVSRDGGIHILKGRHPLIDRDRVIPVTIDYSGNYRTVVITGPNTGGKTVTLKIVGLFALMAQSGLYIPAAYGSSLPVFTGVFCDIGDEQSIEQSLSTFSSHMSNISAIVKEAERGALILLDELGAGTDPEEGACLGMSILKELSNRNMMTLATTHYSEIKAYALREKGFLNASMEFDAESLKPTFRLIMGVAGTSNALLISKGLGLSQSIIDRARSFMSAERIEFDSLLQEAEKTRTRAARELEKAQEMQRNARAIEEKAKKLEAEYQQKKEDTLRKAKEEAYEIISDAKDESERLIKEIRKTRKMSESESTKIVQEVRRDLSEKKERAKKRIQRPETPSKALSRDEVMVGDTVRILSLGVDGTVTSLPDQKDNVGVMAGIMQMNVKLTDLEKREPEKKKKTVAGSRVRLIPKTVSLSINLHGMTVEDAIIELNQYLDEAFLSGLKEVSVVHGKGSGALRSGVQQFLKGHPHVKSYRLGKYGEGETGVTVVTLK